jgi:hypothetical protein
MSLSGLPTSIKSLHLSLPWRTALASLALLVPVAGLSGCQRGEKSCRYYSLVLEKAASPDDQMRALESIKKMSGKDILKCDDKKVLDRFAKAMDSEKLRPLIVDTLEVVGRSGGKLRLESEKLLLKGLASEQTAGQTAAVIRNWRIETAESGKEAWLPSADTAQALATAIGKFKKGEVRSQLVESLFLSVADPAARAKYTDLLIELASTDPSAQTVDVNLKSLSYLTEMFTPEAGKPSTVTEPAFEAFVQALYLRDAARAETFMAGRLALANAAPDKVTEKMLGIFTKKDEKFAAWAKTFGLYDWEWQAGPKAMQVFVDQADAKTLPAILDFIGKTLDTIDPPTWKAVKKAEPYANYVVSAVQLSTWAIAAMGEGVTPYADKIVEITKNSNFGLEQRLHPLLGLALSGSSKSFTATLAAIQALPPGEKPDLLPALAFAVSTRDLDTWNTVIGGSTEDAVKKFREDASIKARLKVIEDCKKAEDAAADEAGKTAALLSCFKGVLTTGDDPAKEKAAVGLIQLGVQKGADVVPLLLEAHNKSQPTSVTLRQITTAGVKALAKPAHTRLIYQVKEEQVAYLPGSQPWIWDFQVLLGHLLQKEGALPVGNIPGAKALDAPKAATPAAP